MVPVKYFPMVRIYNITIPTACNCGLLIEGSLADLNINKLKVWVSGCEIYAFLWLIFCTHNITQFWQKTYFFVQLSYSIETSKEELVGLLLCVVLELV